MFTDFKELMSKKTNEELLIILADYKRYSSYAISDALNELKSRGVIFTDDQIIENSNKIKELHDSEVKDDIDPNLSDDVDLPLLYTRRAILFFSNFCSVLFGCFLLAANVIDKKRKIILISVGLFWTFLVMMFYQLLENYGLKGNYAIYFNTAGYFLIDYLFWNRYIGKGKKYGNKPIWKPLIIAIAMYAVIIFLIYKK